MIEWAFTSLFAQERDMSINFEKKVREEVAALGIAANARLTFTSGQDDMSFYVNVDVSRGEKGCIIRRRPTDTAETIQSLYEALVK